MTRRVFYQCDNQGGVEMQNTFYRPGDVLVNPQKVPYRLTREGWKLISEDELKALLQHRVSSVVSAR